MRLFFILLLAPMAAVALDLTDQQRADIEHADSALFMPSACREKPVVVADAMVTSAGRSGEDVYNGACMACHSAGIAGAPKVGDQIAWAGRISQGHGCAV